jgi:hypothetical protein
MSGGTILTRRSQVKNATGIGGSVKIVNTRTVRIEARAMPAEANASAGFGPLMDMTDANICNNHDTQGPLEATDTPGRGDLRTILTEEIRPVMAISRMMTIVLNPGFTKMVVLMVPIGRLTILFTMKATGVVMPGPHTTMSALCLRGMMITTTETRGAIGTVLTGTDRYRAECTEAIDAVG